LFDSEKKVYFIQFPPLELISSPCCFFLSHPGRTFCGPKVGPSRAFVEAKNQKDQKMVLQFDWRRRGSEVERFSCVLGLVCGRSCSRRRNFLSILIVRIVVLKFFGRAEKAEEGGDNSNCLFTKLFQKFKQE
jgi:hypothetical protein